MRFILLFLFLISSPAIASPPAMQVDGAPYFPIGWYTSAQPGSVNATRDYLSVMKAQGMNSALICYGVEDSDTAMINYLQGAGQIDMTIMVEVQRYAVQGLEGYPPSIIDHQVDVCKDYPSMLGWYLMDEPEYWGVTPAMLQDRYAQIKGRDPVHDIFVCHGTYLNHNPAIPFLNAEPPPYTDGFMPYTYVINWMPEFGNELWQVTQAAKADVALAQSHGKHAVIDVLQAHEWSNLRLPTYPEQRYQSYGPVTVGARGIYYWMYYDSYSPESYRTTVIGPIAREISSLIPAILSNSAALNVTSNRDSDTLGHAVNDVTYLFGEDEHAGYLIAANNTPKTIPVTFNVDGDISLGPNAASIPVMFESRNVTLSPFSKQFTDTFTPYDVNVYRLYVKDASVSIDLGLPDISDGIILINNDDGGTIISNTNGVNCRANENPSGSPADNFFYFSLNDSFAYQGNNTNIYITMRYYDSGTGSLELQYDAIDLPYKSGGTVALTGSNTWKQHTFHVNDAYFGNRQNGGADFRIFGGANNTFYLDTLRVEPGVQVTSDKVDGLYKTDEEFNIQVKFQQPVFVTGTPQIELETGPTDYKANYISGSGTNTLTFSYIAQRGDISSDLDFTNKNALMLNGGSIKDVIGNDIDLTLPAPRAGGSLGNSKKLIIDTTPTTILDLTSDKPDGIYKTADQIDIRVKLQTPVFVIGNPQIEFETGFIDSRANYVSGSGTDTLTFLYNVQRGDTSSDLECPAGSSIILNSGSIRDVGGVDIIPAIPLPGSIGSLSLNKNLIIDTTPTTILDVTSDKPNGQYKIGEQINLQLRLQSPVIVIGNPQIEMETGLIDSRASYVSGSGTNTLLFSYTVQPGDTTPDLECNAIIMNGGSVKDTGGIDIISTLPLAGVAGSLSLNKDISIDGIAPTILNVTSTNANGTFKQGSNIFIQVVFSETLVITGSPRLRLETGDVDQLAVYFSGNNSNTLTFMYQFQLGDTSPDLDYAGTDAFLLNGATVRDTIGNDANLTLFQPGSPGSLGYNKNFVVDAIKPTITSVTSDKPDGAYKAGENIDIKVLFNENVNVTGTPQLELETGTVDRKAAYISGYGTNTLIFRYTVLQGDVSADLNYKATNSLTVSSASIKDIAGNTATLTLPALTSQSSLSSNKALVIDTAAPTSTATPIGGVYSGTRLATLSAIEPATIYYTMDGTEPSSGSSVYTNPIELTADTTLRFYAIDTAGNEESPKNQVIYNILSSDGSIGLARQLDNEPVRLGNKVLYLKWPGFAYIEEQERWSGIRIEGNITANAGDLVCLTGTVKTSTVGEKYILLDRITPSGSFSLSPLACSNVALGWPLMDGLYIKTWGKVKPGSIGDNNFSITDGSNGNGIKVLTQETPGVSENEFVIITGAAACENGRIIYGQ